MNQREPVIFKCRHCQTPLGVHYSGVLQVGAVKFRKSVSLQCAVCGRAAYWTPEKTVEVKAA